MLSQQVFYPNTQMKNRLKRLNNSPKCAEKLEAILHSVVFIKVHLIHQYNPFGS